MSFNHTPTRLPCPRFVSFAHHHLAHACIDDPRVQEQTRGDHERAGSLCAIAKLHVDPDDVAHMTIIHGLPSKLPKEGANRGVRGEDGEGVRERFM